MKLPLSLLKPGPQNNKIEFLNIKFKLARYIPKDWEPLTSNSDWLSYRKRKADFNLLPHSKALGHNGLPDLWNWTWPMLALVWQEGTGTAIQPPPPPQACLCMPPPGCHSPHGMTYQFVWKAWSVMPCLHYWACPSGTTSGLNFISLLKQCYQIIASSWLLTSVRHSPSHLVYWNGLWEQCLPVGHCPLVWTGP